MTTGEIQATNRRMVVIAALSATFLAALDASIVGTAMPTIIGQLGGISIFSWVFSIYLLTSTTTVPLYGRLADLYGRKPVFLVAAALFLLGSALSGVSQSMLQLIIFRAIQGIGAGGILPVTMTIIGDLYTAEARAKMTGLFSAVWGSSALLGPTLGGFIVDYLSWRWVFYINLPFGIAAMALFYRNLQESPERGDARIDYIGAATLTASVTAVMLALLQLGEGMAWSDAIVALPLVAGLALLGIFLWHERRFASPMLPLELFRRRIISVVFSSNILIGGVMFGITAYVPLYAQGVLGGSAVDAGLILLPFSVAWSISSPLSGRVIVRAGYRISVVAGSLAAVLGSGALQFLESGGSAVPGMVASGIVGIGMGLSSTAMMISAQNSVGWNQRGVVTALFTFSRTMGGAIGVAALGSLLTSAMTSRLAGLESDLQNANALLDPEIRDDLTPEIILQLREALDASLHQVYLAMLIFALIAAAIVIARFPRGSIEELRIVEESQPREIPAERQAVASD